MILKAQTQPHPIKFKDSEEGFTLFVRRPSATERAGILDAISSQSMEVLHRAVLPLIVGWADIESDTGEPKRFEVLDDKSGEPSGDNNLPALLQAVSVKTHFKIVCDVLAFVGLTAFADRIMADIDQLVGHSVAPSPLVASDPAK